MTNGDKFKKEIAKKSNDEFVDILMGSMCEYCIHNGKNCGKKSCKDGIKAWFNIPCRENPPTEKNHDKTMINNAITAITDNVNHPAHYNFGKIEVIDFIEQQHLGFHLGNSVKYISRAGRKDPAKTIEDLKKAVWYLNRQIEKLERELDGQNG